MIALRIVLTVLLSIFCALGLLQGLLFLLAAAEQNEVLPALDGLVEIPGNIMVLVLGLMGMWPGLRPEAWR